MVWTPTISILLIMVAPVRAFTFVASIPRQPAVFSVPSRACGQVCTAADDDGSGETSAEKLARLQRLEQGRFLAERKQAPKTRKTPMEKLRIAFFGKKIVDTGDASAVVAADLFRMPPDNAEHPSVSAPVGFSTPVARPFRVTGDLRGLLSSIFALLARFLSGLLVVGWKPRLRLAPHRDRRSRGSTTGAEEGQGGEEGKGEGYMLKLPLLPLYLTDTSSVLRGEVARPTGRLILYEFDSSPFCRKVRDACSQLDLTIEMRPTPGAGIAPPNAFSDEHLLLHGKRTVPFLIDEGRQVAMFESEDIVSYLYETYGPGADQVPFFTRGLPALISSGTAAVIRGMPADHLQVDARADNHLMKPLTLYGHEGSPFVHPCREKLCALGLPHTVVPCARGSANRAALTARTGRQFQVPHLVDPNTGVEMSESIEIRMYLDRVYTTSGYTPLRGGSYLSELQ